MVVNEGIAWLKLGNMISVHAWYSTTKTYKYKELSRVLGVQ